MVRVDTPSGAPFFRLDIPNRKGDIPWQAVEQAAGKCRTRVLLPDGIKMPPQNNPKNNPMAHGASLDFGLRCFVPKRLPLLLALQTAQQVLRRCNTPAQHLSVTLVDPKCVLTRAIEPLVMLAGSLRVYTTDLASYRQTASLLLQRFGVTLILSDSPGCFANSNVVVAEDFSHFTGKERGMILTANRTASLRACRIVRGTAPQLPPAFEALRPAGIDPLMFAGALFELCGIKEMERLVFQELFSCVKNELVTVDDLAEQLDAQFLPFKDRA
jgi:hypothetical protein